MFSLLGHPDEARLDDGVRTACKGQGEEVGGNIAAAMVCSSFLSELMLIFIFSDTTMSVRQIHMLLLRLGEGNAYLPAVRQIFDSLSA